MDPENYKTLENPQNFNFSPVILKLSIQETDCVKLKLHKHEIVMNFLA